MTASSHGIRASLLISRTLGGSGSVALAAARNASMTASGSFSASRRPIPTIRSYSMIPVERLPSRTRFA